MAHMKATLKASGIQPLNLPEVRFPKEDWQHARKKVLEPKWAQWLQKSQQATDQWITLEEREDHFKPVGWAHDYIHKSGRWRSWSPETPLPSGVSDKVAAAWRMHVRVHNIEQMLQAVKLYRLHGNTQYRDWVIAQMDLYAKAYTQLPVQTWNGEAQLFNQSLDEAIAAFHFLEIIRLLNNEVDKEKLSQWKANLFTPMAENLMTASARFNNNISVWIASSVSSIGKTFNIPSYTEFGMHSKKGLLTLLEKSVSDDYFWNENSLSYYAQ